MPANTAIIGRVAVKVLPDTGDFRKDAERKLNAIEKTLKFEIPTTLDMSGASRQFLEELRKINARNQASDARKIRFYTTISTSGMREEVSAAARKLNAYAAAQKITFNGASALIGGEIDHQALDEVERELKHWARSISPLTVEVKPDFSSTAGLATSLRLDVLARPRKVSLLPVVDSKAATTAAAALAALSGARVLGDAFDSVTNALKNLDKSVPLIGTLTLAVAGLAGWGLTAGSNLAALSASLASIAPAALALPGIFGGMAVGLGITVIALKDLKKALPDVYAQFQQMAKTITTNFWAGAATGIRDLATVYLPHLGQAATQVGVFWGKFAEALSKPFHSALGPMFDNLQKSLLITSDHASVFASIIAQLGLNGSQYLPRLAQWFVNISTEFDNWLKKVISDGSLDTWVNNALALLHQLGQALQNLGGIFAGIGKAALAAGGSDLFMFADTLGKINTVVNGPAFQGKLVQALSSAHEMMHLIGSQSGPAIVKLFSSLSDTLAAVLPTAGRIIGELVNTIATGLSSPAVQQGIKALIGGLAIGMKALEPAISSLGPVLGALGQTIGMFAQMLGPILGAAVQALAPAFVAIASAVRPLIVLLGSALLQVVQMLAPVIAQLAGLLTNLISNGVMPALQAVISALVPVIGAVIKALMPAVAAILPALTKLLPVLATAFAQLIVAVAPLIPVLLQLLTAIILPLLPAITQIATNLLPPLIAAIGAVVQAILPLLTALTAVVSALMVVLVPVLNFVIGILAGALTAAINGVAQIFNGAIELVTGIWNTFAGFFTGSWGQMWNGIKNVFKGIWDLIVGIINVAINVGILGIFGKGIALLKGIWALGWTALRLEVELVWTLIQAGFSRFMAALGESPRAALSALTSLFRTVWNGILSIFESAWSNLGKTVVNGIGDVVKLVASLPGKAKEAIGDLGGVLIDAGKKLIEGLIKGITGMFGSVKDTLGNLTSKLTDWKGPPSTDRVLLEDAGRMVIGGFINGMESRYDEVRKSLRGLTSDVGNMDVEAPGFNVAARLTGIANGAYAHSEGAASKTLNYYAAPGSAQLSSEEELFSAAGRARMVGW